MTTPRRPGGGRKPKDGNGTVLLFPTDEQAAALKAPPGGLPENQQAFWRQLAPLAIEQGTLVDSTVPGFRELCELLALKGEIAGRLDKFGSDGKVGGERMRNYTKLSARIDATLARFKLTPFGKPVTSKQKASTATNPFAFLMGGQK